MHVYTLTVQTGLHTKRHTHTHTHLIYIPQITVLYILTHTCHLHTISHQGYKDYTQWMAGGFGHNVEVILLN